MHLWWIIILNIGCTLEVCYPRVAGFLRIHIILSYFKQKEMQHMTWSQWTDNTILEYLGTYYLPLVPEVGESLVGLALKLWGLQ